MNVSFQEMLRELHEEKWIKYFILTYQINMYYLHCCSFPWFFKSLYLNQAEKHYIHFKNNLALKYDSGNSNKI